MEELREIINDFWDELEGAKHYAEKAREAKSPECASRYREMAEQELHHAKELHEMGKKVAEGYGTEAARAVWAWEDPHLQHHLKKTMEKVNK